MVQVISTVDFVGKETTKVKCGCGLDEEVSSREAGLEAGENHRKAKRHSWDFPKVQVFNTFNYEGLSQYFPTLESSDRSILQ